MSRGRTPKPTSLKALEGNPGHNSKRDLSGKEPAPPAGAPEPPSHLDDRARRKWFERVAIMMKVAGWLTLFDSDVLAAYCSAYSQWQEAEEQLPQLKAEHRKAKGKRKGTLLNDINQMIGQRRTALRDMRTFGSEIGWSSASRTRIRLHDGQLPLPGMGAPAPTQQEPEETPLQRAQRLAGA